MSDQTPQTTGTSLAALLAKDDTKKRFGDILGLKAAGFISSILSVANSSQDLANCEPRSIVAAAAIAATLDLPINPNLGFAYIVPYSGRAQFQMGWKGFVQLAIRTGEYKTMNTAAVYADELKFWDPITGEIEFTPRDTWKQRYTDTGKVVGYASYFRLIKGFEKFLYMSVKEVTAHGKKFSKSFASPKSQWTLNFDSMALKTLMKLNLSKYGILSIEMQTAITADQAVIGDSGEVEYLDRPIEGEVVSKPSGHDRMISDAEFKLLCARGDANNINPALLKEYIKEKFNKDHRKELSVEELSITIKWMEAQSKAAA